MNVSAFIKATPISPRQLENSIRLGVFFLVILSGIALFLTQKLQISSVILVLATALAWFLGKYAVRAKFWEVASFFYLVFFFVDILYLPYGLAPALVRLFIFILINKLFNLQSPRDFYQIFLVTFLTILAASSLSVEIEMLYVIVLYVMLLIWNIVSITLFMEWKKEKQVNSFPFSLFNPFYCMIILISGVITFAIALGIFFILPRMQLGFFGNLRPGKVQHVSGFSQKVSLGDISRIESDEELAMRVRVTPKEALATGRLYWRGIAFDHYDGRSWSNTVPGTRFLPQDSSGSFYNASSVLPVSNDSLIKQEFYLNPIDTRVIFGLDRIIKIRGPFHAVTRDNNWTLTGMSRAENYEVYSRANPVSRKQLENANTTLPENIKRYYLQLPFRNLQIESLATQITTGRSLSIDRVLAVKHYLETQYKYTATNLPRDSKDPVAVFLFKRKAGHCEYFATSMALLLRYLGIPSRVVNGFLQGEYNEIGDFYAVRQTDAHSWVEAYFDGSWIPFDPSPRPLGTEGGWLRSFFSLHRIVESVGFFWDRYILIFSAQDQLNALSSARERYDQIKAGVKGKYRSAPFLSTEWLEAKWKKYRVFLITLLFAFSVIFYALRHHSRRKRILQISHTPVLFYQEMLLILRKKGFSREPHLTPTEFLNKIQQEMLPVYSKDVSYLTDLFHKSRFGNYALTPSEQEIIRTSLGNLEQM